MATLFVIQGRDQGRQFTLGTGRKRIGRDAASDIQLLDSEVSRIHAAVIANNDGFQLLDLDSSNGTFVNGQQIREHALRTGDRVQVGRTLMIFTGVEPASSLHAEHGVDIVHQALRGEQSQIISSLRAGNGRDGQADRDLQLLYDTSLAVGRTLDIPELLERILSLILERVSADRGCIMLVDVDTAQLQPAAQLTRSGLTKDRLTISRTILDYVMQNRVGVRTSDAQDDRRWDAGASIIQNGVREALCVPLEGRYGMVGAIYVDTYSSPGQLMDRGGTRFTDDNLRLLTAIAHQASLAIEDTHYYSAMVQSERLAAIGQTIATLSHHIKNILQGIRGGSYLIDTGLSRQDNEAVRRGWKMVEKNQEKISSLVLDMLSLSKERQPELISGNLNETVADVVELMQSRANEANCRLIWTGGEVPESRFDPEALHRAILNIVTNAIDAVEGREEATIQITTGYDEENGLWIDVKDNGPGIATEDQQAIFALFESRKGARGTGLGLPVSRKIMREHGGDIVLTSQLGAGATFRLILPFRGPLSEDEFSRDTIVDL